jgi:hypothetical protein
MLAERAPAGYCPPEITQRLVEILGCRVMPRVGMRAFPDFSVLL